MEAGAVDGTCHISFLVIAKWIAASGGCKVVLLKIQIQFTCYQRLHVMCFAYLEGGGDVHMECVSEASWVSIPGRMSHNHSDMLYSYHNFKNC